MTPVSRDLSPQVLLSVYVNDIVLFLTPSGQIMEANDAAVRAYGYSRTELLNKNISAIRAPGQRDDIRARLREARRTGVRFETIHCRADGTTFPVEVVSSAAAISGQPFLMSVIRDISDRRRSENELQRQAWLLDLTGDAVLSWHLDGNIIYWNKGAENLYGFTKEEAIGRSSHDLLKTEFEQERTQFLDALRKHREWVGELRHTTKDGQRRIVESRHQVVNESDGRLIVLETNRDITDRKQAEEVLRFREERYRALAYATSQIVWVTDASGAGRTSQSQWEDFTGIDSGEWSWLAAVHPDDRERTEQEWRRCVATGEPYEIEHRLRRRDGQFRIMQARGVPVRDADGRIREWIGTHTDITERKEAEAALALSEEKLRMSLEAAQMGTWDWDLTTGQLIWGPRCRALFGISPEEPVSYERFVEVIHTGDRDRIHAAVIRALEHGAEYDVEMRVLSPSGLTRWIRSKGNVFRDAQGKAVRMSGCALDITERKQDEHALQESEERFRLTFNNAAVGIAHVALDGRWLRINQKLCEITGYSREELLGATFQRITHPDDLSEDLERAERLISGAIDHYVMEKRYIRRDGSIVWIDLSVSLMRQADGTPDHFISVITDLTARKHAESKLQQRQRDLEEAQRVGGLGSWSWNVSEGTVTWSPELYQIAGYDPEKSAPTYAKQQRLFTADSWSRLDAMVQRALKEGRGYQSDLELIRPDGSHRWVTVRAEADREGSGRVTTLRGTLLDITERKRAEQDLLKAHQELERKVRERTAELAAANTSLRVLTGRLLRLQDDERRRLSRELHDSAGQKLAVLSMNFAALVRQFNEPSVRQSIADSQELIAEISSEIRTMSYLLHPPLLDEVGLESALQWYVDGFSKRSGIQTSVEVGEEFGRLAKEHEIAIFRVVQECLTNVLRHSASPSAEVRLFRRQDRIELEVEDHGKGIPAQRLAALHTTGSTGVGLGGMRERLRQLEGELEVVSSETGTKVKAWLPLVEVKPDVFIELASD